MWVLFVLAYSGGVTSAEFTTRERCITAQEFSIKRKWVRDAYCVQK